MLFVLPIVIFATFNMPVLACVTAHTALTGYLPFRLLPHTGYLPFQLLLMPFSLLSCIAHLCKHLVSCVRFLLLEPDAKRFPGVTRLPCQQTLIPHEIAAAGKEATHNSGTSN